MIPVFYVAAAAAASDEVAELDWHLSRSSVFLSEMHRADSRPQTTLPLPTQTEQKGDDSFETSSAPYNHVGRDIHGLLNLTKSNYSEISLQNIFRMAILSSPRTEIRTTLAIFEVLVKILLHFTVFSIRRFMRNFPTERCSSGFANFCWVRRSFGLVSCCCCWLENPSPMQGCVLHRERDTCRKSFIQPLKLLHLYICMYISSSPAVRLIRHCGHRWNRGNNLWVLRCHSMCWVVFFELSSTSTSTTNHSPSIANHSLT